MSSGLDVEHVGTGTTTLTGSTSTSGTTTVSAGRLEFGNGGALTHLLSGNVVNDAEIAVNGTGISIFSGDHSGGGSLEQNGSGTLVLNGDNTHTGGTNVLAGELHIGNGGTSGSIAGDIANEGLVVFNRSDASTYDGVISGSGDLVKSGQGTFTMTGDHTFTGMVDVEVGTLTLNGGFGAGGLVTIFTNATLNGSGSIERDVAINADGTLGGNLIVNGNVTTSSVNNLGSVSTGTSTAQSNETLVVDQATGGTIDATAGTTQISNLDGATVEAGILGATIDMLSSGSVNSTGGVRVNTLSGGDINVGTGANVTAEQGTFTGRIDGDGGLVKQGTGTLRLESPNNHGGTTQVWGGTLEILNLGALGRVPVVRLKNNGTFRVVDGADVRDAEIVVDNPLTEYRHDFGTGGNLENSARITDGDQSAKIGAGNAGAATSMTATFNQANRLSLEGIDGSTFGLLMSDTLPDSMVASEAFLGWYDPADGEIKNAVVGNQGIVGTLAGFHEMSFEAFLADNGGWNATTMLGAYGTDLLIDEVWAVIDHNSEFTVVPEPAAVGLIFGLVGWIFVCRRRRH